MKKLNKTALPVAAVVVGLASSFVSGAASATTYIPAAITEGFTQATTDVQTIGGAVLLVLFAIVVIKWIKRSL